MREVPNEEPVEPSDLFRSELKKAFGKDLTEINLEEEAEKNESAHNDISIEVGLKQLIDA